jgi:ribosomal protein S18 acetylase RimI-like enzyme
MRNQEMKIRCAEPADYDYIISTLNDWWGGRLMCDMLPRLFLVHFRDTSFVAEEGGEIIGFLIGFLSQARAKEAYVHFAGVHPGCRGQGVGRALYERFFETVRREGRTIVRCVTSPVNKGSIVFHARIGFKVEGPEGSAQGVGVYPEYDGPGNDRVLFVRQLTT